MWAARVTARLTGNEPAPQPHHRAAGHTPAGTICCGSNAFPQTILARESNMEIEKKLGDLGYELPPPPAPAGNYVPAVRTGNLIFLSGQGPGIIGGGFLFRGKLGSDLTIEQGYDCARQTMLNLLTSLKGEIGDLDKVRRVVKLLCMINCVPDFNDPPKVANGASDLLVNLYGEAGRHARSAVGMASLPYGIPVEIEMVVEVEA
jgi:enamine deaminase RidA (YjgF/YER057c/UK114 family)